jgi:hypothetical protein
MHLLHILALYYTVLSPSHYNLAPNFPTIQKTNGQVAPTNELGTASLRRMPSGGITPPILIPATTGEQSISRTGIGDFLDVILLKLVHFGRTGRFRTVVNISTRDCTHRTDLVYRFSYVLQFQIGISAG